MASLVRASHVFSSTPDYELIDASDGVRADFGRGVAEEEEELGDEDVERPIDGVVVQRLGRVLADLLQGAEGSFAHVVILRVQHLTQRRQQLLPIAQLPFANHRRDENTYRDRRKFKMHVKMLGRQVGTGLDAK